LFASAALSFLAGCAVTNTGSTPSPTQPTSVHNQWTWVSGSNTQGQLGSYGERGTAASGNVPGARQGAVGWTDSSGNLWLFGGIGAPIGAYCDPLAPACTGGTPQVFNDLWKFSNGQWTWVAGSSSVDQPGVYGTLGIGSPANSPGARYGAVSWIDPSGNLFLFGGTGYDANGNNALLNDLWEFINGQWIWVGGSNLNGHPGTYGTLGSPAAANFPGARTGAIAVQNSAGDFLLFGGQGCDSTANCGGALNDLWKYSAGQWTWLSGLSVTYPAQPGIYGSLGVPAPTNDPGARWNTTGWMDSSGKLWLYGGVGYGLWDDNVGDLNDFWAYSARQWAWMGGQNNPPDTYGIYGTLGAPASTNIPGSRSNAMSWSDSRDNLWFFGGEGFGSAYSGGNYFNDLWKFNAGQWTWIGGSSSGSQYGVYGSEGTPAAINIPGGRNNAVTWTDQNGNLWLFGGQGLDSQAKAGPLNDLWEYQP
jgi:hypothetical protein